MTREDEIFELEKGFWTASFAGDGAYYAEHLAEDALLVFAEPTGVLEKSDCVRIIGESPASEVRWELSDPRFVELGEGVVGLTYRGSATPRGGSDSQRDRRSSVYRREGDRWKLVLHHVTNEASPAA